MHGQSGYLEHMDANTTAGKIADLGTRMDEAVHASGPQAVEKQHARGKMTARERILALVDEGSFTEMDEFCPAFFAVLFGGDVGLHKAIDNVFGKLVFFIKQASQPKFFLSYKLMARVDVPAWGDG